jgi:hypothetical protein
LTTTTRTKPTKRKPRTPGETSTTTPAGIAANDPDAAPHKHLKFRGDIVGPKCPACEHGLVIDPEIRDLIDPLTKHERAELEKSLQKNGCLDPLKGWLNTGVLLDGHNRYDICAKRNIPVAVEWLPFADRASAIDWILTNQLARRNITPEQRDYLIGRRLENEKQRRGGDRKSKPQPDASIAAKPRGKTSARIAKETGVSTATVERNGVFSKAVDRLVRYGAKKPDLLSGRHKMSQATAQLLTTIDQFDVTKIAEQLRGKKNHDIDKMVAKFAPQPEKPRRETAPAPTAATRATKPPAEYAGLPQDFLDTVLSRLDNIESIGSNSVQRLTKELKTFVKGWA